MFEKNLTFHPLFDYSSFVDREFLSDCEIRFSDGSDSPIKCHTIVIANSSKFFYNAFTSDATEETKTGIVYVDNNIMGLFRKIINWMYDGLIDFTEQELMPLLFLADFYIIDGLKNILLKHIGINATNPFKLMQYADQCFQFQLPKQLKLLEPYFADLYKSGALSIPNISRSLDVISFINVLNMRKDLSIETKIRDMTEFLNDPVTGKKWNLEEDEEEIKALKKFFNIKDPKISKAISMHVLKPYWFKYLK